MSAATPFRDDTALAAVVCENLTVRYGSHLAVSDLSFVANPGEVLALLGPNGAGKTSTVETLEGYRAPSEGRVKVLDLDPRLQHRQLSGRIGVMLQRGGVYPMLGSRRIVDLFASYYRDPLGTEDLLALVGLTKIAQTPWRQLSGGEQQRLSLACALVGRPEVVFLDEPTAGVDPQGRVVIREVLAKLRDQKATVLLTTHELAEAELLADRVIIMNEGRIVAEGSPTELASSAAPLTRFAAPTDLDVELLGAALGADVREESAGHYVVAGTGTPALTAALATWLASRDIAMSELRTGRSLEEAYLAVIGDQPEPPNHEPLTSARGRRSRRRGTVR